RRREARRHRAHRRERRDGRQWGQRREWVLGGGNSSKSGRKKTDSSLKMARIFNFSAGPAVLPEEVLSRAGDEMLDWHGTGMCVMGVSHRGKGVLVLAAADAADL